MKTFKQRVEQLKVKGHGEGKYLLQAIPNNEEGKAFLKMFRKHLNRDYWEHYTQGRKDQGSWSHSITPSKADHLVLYAKPKEKEFFRRSDENTQQRILNTEETKLHQIKLLKQQINLISKKLEELE